jgi:hypothetical protein
MPVITETVETDLPINEVFDYVAHFENIVEWDPGVTAARKVGPDPAGVGTEYALDLQYGDSAQSMVYRITEWDPPHRVVLEGDGSRTFAIDRISFHRTASTTLVEYQADIRMKGLFRAVQPFLGRLFREIGTGAAKGLDQRLRELAAHETEA